MTVETLADLRAMMSETDFAIRVILADQSEVIGVFDQNFDQALEINGRRTTLRVVNEDSTTVAVGQTLTLKEAKTVYTVRAIEKGARTTVFILEQT